MEKSQNKCAKRISANRFEQLGLIFVYFFEMLSKTRLLLSLGQNTVLRRAAPVQILSGGNGNDTRRYNKEASKVIEKSEADSSYSKFVEPVPIDHLDITHNIEKVQKNGSLFNGYVLGEWDKDLIK